MACLSFLSFVNSLNLQEISVSILPQIEQQKIIILFVFKICVISTIRRARGRLGTGRFERSAFRAIVWGLGLARIKMVNQVSSILYVSFFNLGKLHHIFLCHQFNGSLSYMRSLTCSLYIWTIKYIKLMANSGL